MARVHVDELTLGLLAGEGERRVVAREQGTGQLRLVALHRGLARELAVVLADTLELVVPLTLTLTLTLNPNPNQAVELKSIRDYYDERYYKEKEFIESLSVWQLSYMSEMFLAEIERKELPMTILSLKKNLRKVKSALEMIQLEAMRKAENKKHGRTQKRKEAAIEAKIGTPGKRARR